MDEALKSRLERIRSILRNDPDTIVAGDLRDPATDSLAAVWAPYAALLRIADGGRLGVVDLWSAAELLDNAWVAEHLPGGPEKWLAIGQLLYEPIGMNREGKVTVFPAHAPPRSLGTLDSFLEAITGPGYARLFDGADQTPWWEVLRTAGFDTDAGLTSR